MNCLIEQETPSSDSLGRMMNGMHLGPMAIQRLSAIIRADLASCSKTRAEPVNHFLGYRLPFLFDRGEEFIRTGESSPFQLSFDVRPDLFNW
jgi:hypothetical protein